MDRTVHRSSLFSTRLGRYAAMLGALPSVVHSIKELSAIASALDRAETQRDPERHWARFDRPASRSAA